MHENNRNDIFADIASQRISYRDSHLIEPEPIPLPDIYLPSESDPASAFSPGFQIDSAEKLSAELEKCRQRFKPFLQNLAPRIDNQRVKVDLKSFDWRIGTQDDSKDFSCVLAGKGLWQKVNIPHYGEPLGLAVTYYRTTFNVTKEQLDTGSAFIHFEGVDYKAQIFINGAFIGAHEGFFSPFEFDFTDYAHIGENSLVVKVENDYIMGGNKSWGQNHSGEKIYAATGLGYDEPLYGWHHCAPGMGIYHDVYVEFRPEIFISDIFVRPLPHENKAQAWIEIYSCRTGEKPVSLNLSVYGQNFEQTVIKDMKYDPSGLNISGLNDDLNIALEKANGTFNKPVPLLMERGLNYIKVPFEMNDFRWWEHGSPWLYQLQVKLNYRGAVLDASARHFGMRSFTMDENSKPKGALYFNGKPIRLRGANTMGHEQMCVFRKDFNQLIDDILLAKICNMNFLRLTQRPVQKEVYDYCDMLGLMTQSDLPTFGCIRRTQYLEALKQVGEVERLVRSHPCNIMVSYINEPFPNGTNKPHRNISRDEMEDFFRAADNIIKHLNPDRVTKPCDGDYDPPSPGIQDRHCYTTWYNGQGLDAGLLIKGHWQPTKKDWYYGCGEFGAEALERQEVMRKYYPTSWLPQSQEQEKSWTPSKIFRAQTGMFHYFFFDSRDTVNDWIEASQNHQARSLKMMAETFRRDNRMVTFAVHLFIDAWPSGWMKTIMDCERKPKKGYFAYRNALAPILPSIRTDRTKFFSGENLKLEAWISNDLPYVTEGLTFRYQIESQGKVIFAQRTDAKLEICKSTFQGYLQTTLPGVSCRTQMTVRLAVVDKKGDIVTENSTEIEVFPEMKAPSIDVSIVGHDGPAKHIAGELGLRVVPLGQSEIILISDFVEYKAAEKQINTLVHNGALAVFLGLANEDTYNIAGSIIEVATSRFNPLHFVSRKTGHPIVDGFNEFDFNYWYDSQADMIKPVIEATFTGIDFTPILTAGNADKDAKWCKVLAAGERKYGEGSFIVCQINLTNRIKHNPTAKMFALNMISREKDTAYKNDQVLDQSCSKILK